MNEFKEVMEGINETSKIPLDGNKMNELKESVEGINEISEISLDGDKMKSVFLDEIKKYKFETESHKELFAGMLSAYIYHIFKKFAEQNRGRIDLNKLQNLDYRKYTYLITERLDTLEQDLQRGSIFDIGKKITDEEVNELLISENLKGSMSGQVGDQVLYYKQLSLSIADDILVSLIKDTDKYGSIAQVKSPK